MIEKEITYLVYSIWLMVLTGSLAGLVIPWPRAPWLVISALGMFLTILGKMNGVIS